MRAIRASVNCILLIMCAALAGCGGSTQGSGGGTKTFTNNTTPSVALNGNFNFTAQSQVQANSVANVGGSLVTDNAGTVTGVMHIVGSNCFTVTTDLPFTGTINNAGALTLSSAVNGQTITITGNASTDGNTISNATYTVSGTGCASGDRGSVNGFRVGSFTGNYTGVFTSSLNGTVTNVSGTLTQATTADVHGFFPLTGTMTITGSTCFTSLTVQNSAVAGVAMLLEMTASDGALIDFVGTSPSATVTGLSGTYTVTGGACNGDRGTASLTRT